MRDIIWRILKIGLIAAILFVTAPIWLLAGFAVYYFFDNDLSCKDMGLLWDKHQRVCRDDCPVLIYPYGCVFLTPADQAVWDACVTMPQTDPRPTAQPCDRQQMRRVLFDLCAELDGAWDEEAGACDFWKRGN